MALSQSMAAGLADAAQNLQQERRWADACAVGHAVRKAVGGLDRTAMGCPATFRLQCMHLPPHPSSVSGSSAVHSLCGRCLPTCTVPQGAGRPSNVHPNACVDGVRSIGGRQAATTWGDGWGADRCGRRADRSGGWGDQRRCGAEWRRRGAVAAWCGGHIAAAEVQLAQLDHVAILVEHCHRCACRHALRVASCYPCAHGPA